MLNYTNFLARDLSKLLENDDDSDIAIHVGKEGNTKTFNVHINILRARSPFFNARLSSRARLRKEVSQDEELVRGLAVDADLQSIEPETFEHLLRYIYIGSINPNEFTFRQVVDVIKGAQVLEIQELVDGLTDYLSIEEPHWLRENFALIYEIASGSSAFKKLQDVCNEVIDREPDQIFKSTDFSSLPESIVVSLLERDGWETEEIEIWKQIVKWGIANTAILDEDTTKWKEAEFKSLRAVLRQTLPLIRYLDISSRDFNQHIVPLHPLFSEEFYRDLIGYHLDNTHELVSKVLPSRRFPYDESVLLDRSKIAWIMKHMDHSDDTTTVRIPLTNRKFTYRFELILRGSRDGFDPVDFHRTCDDQGPTLTVARVKGTRELVGGYNPLSWRSDGSWEYHEDCFIFSFLNEAILSRIVQNKKAIGNFNNYGPIFGGSRGLYVKNQHGKCGKGYFSVNIRPAGSWLTGRFELDEMEIFRIISDKS